MSRRKKKKANAGELHTLADFKHREVEELNRLLGRREELHQRVTQAEQEVREAAAQGEGDGPDPTDPNTDLDELEAAGQEHRERLEKARERLDMLRTAGAATDAAIADQRIKAAQALAREGGWREAQEALARRRVAALQELVNVAEENRALVRAFKDAAELPAVDSDSGNAPRRELYARWWLPLQFARPRADPFKLAREARERGFDVPDPEPSLAEAARLEREQAQHRAQREAQKAERDARNKARKERMKRDLPWRTYTPKDGSDG